MLFSHYNSQSKYVFHAVFNNVFNNVDRIKFVTFLVQNWVSWMTEVVQCVVQCRQISMNQAFPWLHLLPSTFLCAVFAVKKVWHCLSTLYNASDSNFDPSLVLISCSWLLCFVCYVAASLTVATIHILLCSLSSFLNSLCTMSFTAGNPSSFRCLVGW